MCANLEANGLTFSFRHLYALSYHKPLEYSRDNVTSYDISTNSSHEAKHSQATVEEFSTLIVGDSVIFVGVHGWFFGEDVLLTVFVISNQD
jgi:hypothetical protein